MENSMSVEMARKILDSIEGCLAEEEEAMAAILVVDIQGKPLALKLPAYDLIGIDNLEIVYERLRGISIQARDDIGRVIIRDRKCFDFVWGAVGIALRGEYDDERVNAIVEAGLFVCGL